MGHGTFNATAYAAYTHTIADKGVHEIFTSKNLNQKLDPKGVKIRESRDSVDNPNSTPIIVGTDVTGSMGELAALIAKKGLGTTFESILARKPISDPAMMFMAIGDGECDAAPLQVSQFESDNRIVEQLSDTWIEGGGGGNAHESYEYAWYFAAFHTEHDSLIKRGKRGYLFTVGDEPIGTQARKEGLIRTFDDGVERSFTSEELLEAAQRKYNCFHIIIRGGFAGMNMDAVLKTWKPLMGQNLIILDDVNALAETIVSTIEVCEGVDHATSAAHWGTTGHAVLSAIKSLPKGQAPKLLGKGF